MSCNWPQSKLAFASRYSCTRSRTRDRSASDPPTSRAASNSTAGIRQFPKLKGVDRVPLELSSSIVFPRSLVGSGNLPDLRRRHRCCPIAKPGQLITLGRGQTGSDLLPAALVSVSLGDPRANGVAARLKLAGKIVRITASADQVDHLSAKFRRIRWACSWHRQHLWQKLQGVHQTGSIPVLPAAIGNPPPSPWL